jgi:hypothetical protein
MLKRFLSESIYAFELFNSTQLEIRNQLQIPTRTGSKPTKKSMIVIFGLGFIRLHPFQHPPIIGRQRNSAAC